MYRKSIFSDKNDSINTISSPLANSTHIEETSKQRSKCSWSGKSATPKRKATSPLQNSKSIVKISTIPVISKRIDSQVYMDTQSHGLVSRIVKYHEMNQNNERPIIRSNYTKAGEFPIVHLKKDEIVYTPRRTTAITTRIPYLDSSVCQIARRSSILRGDYTITSSNEIQSQPRKDEPFISPIDLEVHTKSVLDALKEISRKRINNEDLEVDSNIKKSCIEYDEIDHPTVIKKRERESTVPGIDTNFVKKNCAKSINNNDILSSLSSSSKLLKANKVNNYGRQSYQSAIATIQPVSGVQNNDFYSNFRTDEKSTQTAVPSQTSATASLTSIKSLKPKITLFNRKYTDNYENYKIPSDDNIEFDFIKPKASNTDDITSGSASENRNTQLSAFQKSKLAMMLSCLRDDDDDDENNTETDTVDLGKLESKPNETIIESPTALISSDIKQIESSTEITKLNTEITISNSALSSKVLTTIGEMSTVTSLVNSSKNEVPVISFGSNPITTPKMLTNQTTVAVTQITTPTTAEITLPKPFTSSAIGSPARIGGFKFNEINSQPTSLISKSVVSAVVSINTVKTSETINKLPSFGFNVATTSNISTTSNNVTIGTLSTPNNTSTILSPSNSTFGTEVQQSQKSEKKSLFTIKAAVPQPAGIGEQNFTFGLKPAASFPKVPQTIAASPPPSYNFKTTTTGSINPTISTTPFSFGLSNYASSVTTKPIVAFGSTTEAVTNVTTATIAPSFTFRTTTSTPTSSNTQSTFTFGGSQEAAVTLTTTKVNNSTFTFGNTIAHTANSAVISNQFGGNAGVPTGTAATSIFDASAQLATTNNNQSKATPNLFNQTFSTASPSTNTTSTWPSGPISTTTETVPSNMFNFGSSTSKNIPTGNTLSNIFGGQQQPGANVAPSLFNFKATKTTQAQSNDTSNLFKYGNTTSNTVVPTFGSQTSSFGVSTESKPIAAAAIFGGNQPLQSSTNANIASFNFTGSSGFSGIKSPTTTTQSVFGTATQSTTQSFSFGSNAQNNQAPAFGSDSTKAFSFSGGNNSNNNPQQQNPFSGNGVTFSSSISSTNPVPFGGTNSALTNPSPFGGPAGTSGVNQSLFSGGPISTDTNIPTFNFTGGSQQPNNQSNLQSNSVFNFNSGSANPVAFGSGQDIGSNNSANPFSIGGGTNSPSTTRRTIRAGRRLK